MNPATRSIRKSVDLSTFSTFSLEDLLSVDALPTDGRANVLSRQTQRPGGMNVYGLHAVRSFDRDAKLALGGLIGGADADTARAAVEYLGADVKALWSIGGKFTNRSEVILGPTTRLILRHTRDVDWQTDLDWPSCRRMLGVIGRSRASLIGNLPVEFTRLAIDFAQKVGTYMGLVAGERQFRELRWLQPDVLIVNCSEAWAATGSNTTDPDAVFDRLVAFSPASVVVMTNGADATHVVDRASGARCRIDPPHLGGRLSTLGAGDVFAGTVTFLLGQVRGVVSGTALRAAIAFGHEVAAAHITADPVRKARIRVLYRDEVCHQFAAVDRVPQPETVEAQDSRRAA